MKTILELRVSDRPGVLDRVVSLIRRRGWNIDSMTVGDMGDSITQITFQLEGRDLDLSPLEDYLSEMDAVHHWQTLNEASHTLREMLLFRLPDTEAPPVSIENIREIRRRGGMRDLEYTEAPSNVNALAQALHARGIPCVRSGPLPLPWGDEEVETNG